VVLVLRPGVQGRWLLPLLEPGRRPHRPPPGRGPEPEGDAHTPRHRVLARVDAWSAHETADETSDHAAAALNPEAALRRRTMTARRTHLPMWLLVLTLLGCDRPDPADVGAPSFTVGGVGRPSVLVNQNANDHGTAKTIQEGIDMVASGGNVLVEPGTYVEAIVIDKGLTLEAIGGETGAVIVAPVRTVNAAIRVPTPDAGA